LSGSGLTASNSNISEPLAGEVQTNQRAELTAILRALQIVGIDENADIRSDSQYAIRCVTEWAPGWEKKGWKTMEGTDVKNRDLVEAICTLMKMRNEMQAQTTFKWLKGHASDAGNNAADELAVNGAKMAKAARLAGRGK